MEELQILQKILLPMKTMTRQLRRQMIAETKRLVLKYLVLEVRDLLSTSPEKYRLYLQQKMEKMAREKKTSTTPSEEPVDEEVTVSSDVLEQPSKAQALIDFNRALEDCAQGELPEAGVVKIVNDCAEMGFRFKKVKTTSDQLLSILNSHSYQVRLARMKILNCSVTTPTPPHPTVSLSVCLSVCICLSDSVCLSLSLGVSEIHVYV